MTACETIFQCTECARFFRAGEVVALTGAEIVALNAADRRDGVAFTAQARLQFAPCGHGDCAETKARRLRAEMVKRNFKRNQRLAANGPAPLDRPCRSPLPPERDQEWSGPTHEPAILEQEFQAIGAADSANALFSAWFKQRDNFNKPFLKKFLEETVMQGKSGCVNNRAKDCRPEFIAGGLYIDNDSTGAVWSENFGWKLSRGSYYRLCRIEDATSLSAEEKLFLLNVGAEPPRKEKYE